MLKPGDRVGPYRIERSIGSGGFATVLLASDDRLRNKVAIKVLADNHASSPDLRRRFFDEGHLLRKTGSDALVTIYDVGEQDGQPYLVLDYCDRGDLASRVADREIEPSADDVRVLIRHLGLALQDLEAMGIAHRDIKPSNLLLASRPSIPADAADLELRVFDADDRLLLSDLGLAKNLAAGSGITLGAGTGSFAAPEQREWLGVISLSTDIYGASALVHWFVSGRPPRHHQPGLVARGDGSIAAAYDGALQAALMPALIKGMSEDPHARHSGAREWAAELLGCLDQPPNRAGRAGRGTRSTAPEVDRDPTEARGFRLAVGLAALLVPAIVGASWWLTTRDDESTDQAVAVESGDSETTTSQSIAATGTEATPDVDLGGLPIALVADVAPKSVVAEVLSGLDKIDGEVAFPPGSVELSEADFSVADNVASVLRSGALVELRGFDDGDGNPALGEERARALQRYLVEFHRLPERLLLVIGVEAATIEQQGTVTVIVRERDDGGLLFSRWDEAPERWEQPTEQLLVPSLRSVLHGCEAQCAIQVEGLLTPLANGEHSFTLASQDQAELWISDSADSSGLQRFIVVGQSDRQEDGSPMTATEAVNLTANRPVYVRLRAVTGTGSGDDGALVSWQTPFGDGPEWISSIVLTPPEQS